MTVLATAGIPATVGYRLVADEARDNGEAMSDHAAWPVVSSSGWFSPLEEPRRSTRPAGPVHQCTTTSVP
ncbi:hypothetical protein [Corynebacterium meridianum]|uniref:Uncharacterized protein n=1 Tax=Corynebacterium meridianum TaxID=2765363 RepID=A0A934HYB2_9CORY|nr:hypothetical protein [Corynebacterium meridianum]MBI8989188.1 hypothetical protein [Corynebacterium meridianum]